MCLRGVIQGKAVQRPAPGFQQVMERVPLAVARARAQNHCQ